MEWGDHNDLKDENGRYSSSGTVVIIIYCLVASGVFIYSLSSGMSAGNALRRILPFVFVIGIIPAWGMLCNRLDDKIGETKTGSKVMIAIRILNIFLFIALVIWLA